MVVNSQNKQYSTIIVYFFYIWSNYKIGETMFKKIILCLTLITLLTILSISKEKTELVYNEITNDSEYRQIYLLFENNILNTNNFEEYLKDIEVLKVYPYINPVYACRGRILSGTKCDFKSHTDNLKTFSVMVNLNMIVKLRNLAFQQKLPLFPWELLLTSLINLI